MRATASWLGPLKRRIRSAAPERRHLRADILAGLPGAISSVPGGRATAILAGAHPIQGLYACFAGPIAGGLTAHNRRMIITTTGAAALAAGSALQDVDRAQRPAAVVLLTILAGAALLAAGILRLGRLTRFVSRPVMIGFLTGIPGGCAGGAAGAAVPGGTPGAAVPGSTPPKAPARRSVFHDHARSPGRNRGKPVAIMRTGPAGGWPGPRPGDARGGRRRWRAAVHQAAQALARDPADAENEDAVSCG